jgi:tRNA A37 threonylcarbamoyladenosine modification protein TsaB
VADNTTTGIVIEGSLNGIYCGLLSVDKGGESSRFLEKEYHPNNSGTSAFLAKKVHHYIRASGPNGRSVDSIFVGNGPGSFTGIKIILSFVAGLSNGSRYSIRSFSSLLAVASAAYKQHQSPKLCILKGTTKSGYAAIFNGKEHWIGRCDLNEQGLAVNLLPVKLESSENDYLIKPSADGLTVLEGSTPTQALACYGVENWMTGIHMMSKWDELARWGNGFSIDATKIELDWFEVMEQWFGNTFEQCSKNIPKPIYIRSAAPEERNQILS